VFSIERCPVPANTILDKYLQNGAYIDCYSTLVHDKITFPEFIFGFYTTPLFRLERWILTLLISKPSTDQEARGMADGLSNTFAAWTVESRDENEILMCDFAGRTRSWLRITPMKDHTRLYFGSAVILSRRARAGIPTLGFGFQALLAFHRMYSILLLYSAKSKFE
jgi:hypothetical protein